MSHRAILLAGILGGTAQGAVVDTLVPRGAVWKYLDDGSDQGTAWRAPAFDDSAWASGPAQLGYGDGDEVTVVSFGPDPGAKFVTTYFRHSFLVADPSTYQTLDLRLQRDDGAVVYLNGTEVVRAAMPAASGYLTLASSTVGGASEMNLAWQVLDPALLVPGTNVLAVEIHQASRSSSDVSFDAELLAGDREFVTRGPYLQKGTSTGIVVRWRTDLPTDSRVTYGLAPGALDQLAEDPVVGTIHEVTLGGLSPDTTYFYAVGSTTQVLAGGDAGHSFTTAPPPGTHAPVRVWVIGDSGTANADAAAVRDAFQTYSAGVPPDLWLMLGDNAYDVGSATDFQAAVFDMYPDLLRTSVLWPTRGNHEMSATTYHDLFSLPAAGEAGGLPSGTEAYYSFDHANIHFVCLDSEGSDRSPGGAMETWLASDLASTDQDWIVAYWHHPPYSKGSHDSDTEGQLVEMRQNFLPVLEAAGVDLVLSGHSHSYERSFLIDGHYGVSSTFSSAHQKDAGDGRVDGTGAYLKEAAPHAGAVYCVAGSSGRITPAPLDHPAMFHSVVALGSVVLDVDGNRMDVTFLDSSGLVNDSFTLRHSPWLDLGNGLAGTHGVPSLQGTGALEGGDPLGLTLNGALESTTAFLILGFSPLDAPFAGGILVPALDLLVALPTGPAGTITLAGTWPAGLPAGFSTYFQYWILDPVGPQGFSASSAVVGTTP